MKRGAYIALYRISHGQGRAPFHFHPKRNKSINRLDRKRHDYHIGRKTERRP
ncbi:hypothetical protein M145_2236 [Bacteroides fragilis str. 34-F-2 |nr:hypothetical protein M077_5212 [Bacteroides fragilis str. 2-F-2 \